MATPLSPAPTSVLNCCSTPPTTSLFEAKAYTTTAATTTTTTTATTMATTMATTPLKAHSSRDDEMENHILVGDDDGDGDSSPFMSPMHDEENRQRQQSMTTTPQRPDSSSALAPPTSAKPRPISRILSGTELSPLKILRQDGDGPQRSVSSTTDPGAHPLPASPASSASTLEPASANSMSLPTRSPRKISAPIKRFPVKVSQPLLEEETGSVEPAKTAVRPAAGARQMMLEDAIGENKGLRQAIEIFEDEALSTSDGEAADGDTLAVVEERAEPAAAGHGATESSADEQDADGHIDLDVDEQAVVDDTMVSTFSTFSAVPNLTMLAHMGAENSPTRTLPGKAGEGLATPRGGRGLAADSPSVRTPKPYMPGSGSAMATGRSHRQPGSRHSGGNTTNLIEFTEQMRYGAYTTPSRRGGGRSLSPSKTTSHLDGAARTPQRRLYGSDDPSSEEYGDSGHGHNETHNHLVNLLDFDIPPLPTPRSIPTITPRELESLKSGFLSEISSLRASLSGKEAEVASLKTAVGDAENRVGACLEQLRECRGRADALAEESAGWEKRGREMEAVLRSVKEEIVLGRRERDELEHKLDEADKRREAAEMMAQEAETKMAALRAGRAAAAAEGGGSEKPTSPRGGGGGGGGAVASNREVELAVERVARELHAAYKTKHETKVAALKKSYEARWEKRVRELQAQADALARENEELRVGRDSTMTRVDPRRLAAAEAAVEDERKRAKASMAALTAEVDRLEATAKSVRADNEELRKALEQERVEKGELVQVAEELMSMQPSFVAAAAAAASSSSSSSSSSAFSASSSAPEPAAAGPRGTPMASRMRERMPQPSRPSSTPATGLPLGGPAPAPVRTTPSATRHSYHPGTRTSGLRAPGGMKSAESRIGRAPGTHERAKSAAVGGGSVSGLPGLGSGLGARSGIMSSIERMGSYHRRAE